MDPQHHAQFVRLLNEKGVATNFESRVFRRDGEIIWISENARAACGGNDEIQFFEGTIEDKSPEKLSAGHVYSTHRRGKRQVTRYFGMPPDNFNSSIFIFPLHLKGKSLQNFYIVSANLHIIKTNLYGGGDGYRIYRGNRCILAGNLCVRRRMRQAGGTSMNTFYVIGAVVSAGLLVYLVMALLKAEDL